VKEESAMRVFIPRPRDVLRLAGRAWTTAEALLELVPRVLALMDQLEDVVRVLRAIDDADVRIAEAVDKALRMVARLEPLVLEFAPTLRTLHPILDRIAETTDPDEVEAMVRLINDLPDLVTRTHVDVLPVLGALGTVPDDLRELLISSKELNHIIAAVPGLGRMRQKALREQEEADRLHHDREQQHLAAPAD
jgi:hypothetical protein